MHRAFAVVTVALVAASLGPAAETRWSQLGGTGIDTGLAGPSGRPVDYVWYSADGSRLYARLASRQLWMSLDVGLSWQQVEDSARAIAEAGPLAPAPGGPPLRIVNNPYKANVSYALGEHLYRTEDGQEWINLTALGPASVIGRWQRSLAVSPVDPNLIVVANSRGLWKSFDQGVTWSSLNGALPNFPATRFQSVLAPGTPTLEAEYIGAVALVRTATGPRWQAQPGGSSEYGELPAEDRLRVPGQPPTTPPGYVLSHRVWRDGRPVSGDLTGCGRGPECAEVGISAFASNGHLWAGTTNGRIWVSRDEGSSWDLAWRDLALGTVTGVWADPERKESALAVVAGRVLRSTNGGVSWFDISSNLPGSGWRVVAGHSATSTAYVGGPLGVYYSDVSLTEPGPAGTWLNLTADRTMGAIHDLALDPLRGRIYASSPGHGVFWSRLPQIQRSLQTLSAANLVPGAAAPGSLLTILGATAAQATAGGRTAPVLATGENRTQLQVPFEVRGRSLRVELDANDRDHVLHLPLQSAAPAIFVVGGEPLVLDAVSGGLVGWRLPARPGASVLVMAAGLGAVEPKWPTGLPAPESNSPRPTARIGASLDHERVEVLSARLAPGYVGIYLVEVAVPAAARPGTAQLRIVADDRISHPVTMVIGQQQR